MSLIYQDKSIFDYYTKYLNSTHSFKISHWNTKESQEKNFTQVVGIIKQYRPKSLLDVGSGIGSIQSFLPKQTKYEGIDIVPEVVKLANQSCITEADIKTYNPDRTFEAVIALGSFNMGVIHEDFMAAIKQMHNLCTKIAVVTVSYLKPEEIEDVKADGWCIINNHTNSIYSMKAGDSQVLIKIK